MLDLAFVIRCPSDFAMPMLPSRDYVSEHTLFIRDLIDKTPADLGEGQQMDEGRVAMLPYVYQTK